MRPPIRGLSITLFLALHAVGAHYTYSETPLGEWMRTAFGWSRNHCDRLVHFSFGLLLTYPMREIALRVLRSKPLWGWILPLLTALGAPASFRLATGREPWSLFAPAAKPRRARAH